MFLTGLFTLKTKYDESDNVVLRATRIVTDKLQDVFSKFKAKGGTRAFFVCVQCSIVSAKI